MFKIMKRPMGLGRRGRGRSGAVGAYAFTASNTIADGGQAGIGHATITGYTVTQRHLHAWTRPTPSTWSFVDFDLSADATQVQVKLDDSNTALTSSGWVDCTAGASTIQHVSPWHVHCAAPERRRLEPRHAHRRRLPVVPLRSTARGAAGTLLPPPRVTHVHMYLPRTSRHRLWRRLTALLVGLAALGAGWFFLAPPALGGDTTYVVTDGVSMQPRIPHRRPRPGAARERLPRRRHRRLPQPHAARHRAAPDRGGHRRRPLHLQGRQQLAGAIPSTSPAASSSARSGSPRRGSADAAAAAALAGRRWRSSPGSPSCCSSAARAHARTGGAAADAGPSPSGCPPRRRSSRRRRRCGGSSGAARRRRWSRSPPASASCDRSPGGAGPAHGARARELPAVRRVRLRRDHDPRAPSTAPATPTTGPADLHAARRPGAGAVRLRAAIAPRRRGVLGDGVAQRRRLASPNGWTRTIPLEAPTAFTGTHVAVAGIVHLRRLERLLAAGRERHRQSRTRASRSRSSPTVHVHGTIAGHRVPRPPTRRSSRSR